MAGMAAMAATACCCCCSGASLGLVGMRVEMAGGSTRGSTGKPAMPCKEGTQSLGWLEDRDWKSAAVRLAGRVCSTLLADQQSGDQHPIWWVA